MPNAIKIGQPVKVDFTEGDPHDPQSNYTGRGIFLRHVESGEPGLEYLSEPHALVQTCEIDTGSLFPLRCITILQDDACNFIQIEYGRRLWFSAPDEQSEWLDDLDQAVDEMMHLPLGGQECPSGGRFSFAPWAFCAPEVIRGAVTHYSLRCLI